MYKKVLIIGEAFSNIRGGGVTLSNLFRGWPKDKLFVATTPNQLVQINYNMCENYYCLGKDERKFRFPLNLIKKRHKSGKLKFNNNIKNIRNENLKENLEENKYISLFKEYITMFIETLLFWLGLYFLCIKLIPSNRFKQWINEIKPDIIYCQFSSLELMTFIEEISNFYQFKLIVHIMDDWPMTLNKSILFKKYWDKVILEKLKLILDKSNLLLSISEGMSIEYLKRYHKEFLPFHNPIDLEKWLPFKKENWEFEKNFSILYTGRIGVANNQSIDAICKVIESINKENNNIRLDIFTGDYNSAYALSIMKYAGVTIHKPIRHDDIPKLLTSYDLLVLPLDFNKDGIKFARLSMPGKASEYMISGTPILLFSSDEMEVVRHAKIHKWALCVTENDNNLLKNAILKFYKDFNIRKMYGKTAHEYALINFDGEKIRKRFKNLICDI